MQKKTLTLAQVLERLEELWPQDGAADWDNSGLLSGDLNQEIHSILLAVDAVAETALEAAEGDFSLLLTHHPLIFRGLNSLIEQSYQGAVLSNLIRANCALLAVHTNADVVPTGTSAVLAKKLGLSKTRVIDPGKAPNTGIGIVGDLAKPIRLSDFAGLLADILPVTASGIRVAGDPETLVQRVALCAGAGDSYLAEALVRESDVYVTSDLRHHPAQEITELAAQGIAPALVDISHWAAESLWLEQAAVELELLLPNVKIAISKTNTDPWDFLVIQHEG
ncbi:MAG: Nif3-like dinuclear metal center hexameric protein [Microbacteriaceae bacterium]